jgi:hypothetical protein
MTRALLALLAAGLVFVSSAHAKGPHAVLTPGPGALEAGRPWEATLELLEASERKVPMALVARQGGTEVVASLRRVASDFSDVRRYEVELTFPSNGRWVLIATGDGRFEFGALVVGSGRRPAESVAFAGVPYREPEPLPPEEFTAAAADEPQEGGGVPVWILPLAGVVLVGAGLLRIRLR